MQANLQVGDCLNILQKMDSNSIDLVYMDPPFLTQKTHKQRTRDRAKVFSFSDLWNSYSDYGQFMYERLKEAHKVLKKTGTIFVHCDHNANHILRILLDEIFGNEMFRSEIIWHYRRWSNSQKTLLPSHQTILFYSKSDEYKFNVLYQEYSPSTNVDQILQKRERDEFGVSVYARDENGDTVSNGEKKGVPLGDVWDIPYLNPKAKERIGYPTQKPILLLERIINLVTDPGDWVLDPFCGSGTTLVAARLSERNSIGIDSSPEAIELSRNRLTNPVKTQSELVNKGRAAYDLADRDLLSLLGDMDYVPVHRNRGIDAFLNLSGGSPIPIRIQRNSETVLDAAAALNKAGNSKRFEYKILIVTHPSEMLTKIGDIFPDLLIVESPSYSIRSIIDRSIVPQATP